MRKATERNGFRIQSPLTDEQIWGIGMVTYQWGSLENDFDFWINAIQGQPITRSSGQRASLKERMRVLRVEVDQKAVEPFRTKFLSAIDTAKEIQDERGAIVHQLWVEQPNGKTGVSEWRNKKGKRWTEKAIDFQSLKKLILKIDGIRAELLEVFLKSCLEAGENPSGMTLSTAWQHISRKPDRDL